ncbi:caspase recruitment domain-containing protein 9 [Megalops cyprinoides]|uniref:caspase recruitment domain-containing protein 9 n=1 Tax=Megalops cyprinoides TaxID=118141 RepID=UPI001863BED8|nr:caspase recruitment domain-containing protein 9 [Megalops cyprinoides]
MNDSLNVSDMEDEECWVQLEDYRLLLIKTIEPSRITPYLRQCKVLSSDDEEQIFNDPNLVIRRRKVGVLLDILQRTGHKGYVAFLESLELDYPHLYRKITGKEPARVFSILVDTAGETGLTRFLMSEVTSLQKALQEERFHRQEVSAHVAAQDDTIRQLQIRESELRKQQERVHRMREDRDKFAEEVCRLKDENYALLRDVTRLSEEKNSALMCTRDLQLEIEKLKHNLMNAESDSKIQRKRTMTLKNAMEQRPSQDTVWQIQRQNDLLKARVQELESSVQQHATQPTQTGQESVNIQSLEDYKQQAQTKHQELVNSTYILHKQLREAEELRDKYLEEKDVLELQCTTLEKDSKMYRDRLEDILKQMDEVIMERNKAMSTREVYHQENCKNLQDKDQYRKQIRELGERCDELQIQLFRAQGEIIAMETKLRRAGQHIPITVTSDFEDGSLHSWPEQKSQTSEEEYREKCDKGQLHRPGQLEKDCFPMEKIVLEEELPANGRPRGRCNFHYRRKRALRTKTASKENPQYELYNTSGSDNSDTDCI